MPDKITSHQWHTYADIYFIDYCYYLLPSNKFIQCRTISRELYRYGECHSVVISKNGLIPVCARPGMPPVPRATPPFTHVTFLTGTPLHFRGQGLSNILLLTARQCNFLHLRLSLI